MKIKNKKLAVILISIAVLALAAFFIFQSGILVKKNVQQEEPQEQKEVVTNPAVNGLQLPEKGVTRPIAVMVENHPDSRPQSGLSQADIVYETLAEGGITRFMAIYQTQKVDSIGPVRSARPYFVNWAKELGAVYAHVGGSDEALLMLRQGVTGVSDVDEFFNASYFPRTNRRPAPHNTYTSTDKLLAFIRDYKLNAEKNYSDLLFKDEPASDALPPVETIHIQFSTPLFGVKFVYDKDSNSYRRFNAGEIVIDAGNDVPVQPKTVIVQYLKNIPVPNDPRLIINMNTNEGGKVEVFLDGKRITGTWRVVSGRTKYFDTSGVEIALNRGQIWIAVVPPEFPVLVQ